MSHIHKPFRLEDYTFDYLEMVVNSHDALVSACQAAFDFIDEIENFTDEAREVIEELREALNQAKKEK